PWVEVRVAQHYDDPVSLPPALVQAPAHERRADALPLVVRQDGYWRKGHGRDGPGAGEDRQVAEKDVADDLTGSLGDQRQSDVPPAPQGVHQPGLVIPSEGEAVDVPDGVEVSGGFGSNRHAHALAIRPPCAVPSSGDSSTQTARQSR